MNRIIINIFALFLLTLGGLFGQTLIYDGAFLEEECRAWALPPAASWIEEDGERALQVQGNDEPGCVVLATRNFDFTPYAVRGLLVLSGEVKHAGVSQPRDSWNGVKFMMVIPQKGGKTGYFQAKEGIGDSPWHPVQASVQVGAEASVGRIMLGLQDASGTVWFRRLKMTFVPQDEAFPPLTPPDFQVPYTKRLQDEPVRRGAMSPSFYTEAVVSEDLPTLRSWGANLLRWQITRNWGRRYDNQDPAEYLQWIQSRIPGTLAVLDKAHELGMKVVVDLHVPPGGRDAQGNMVMFDNATYAEAFQEAWRMLATACKGHPALFGYDLINEPSQPYKVSRRDYLGLQYDVARIIREIDPETPIIVEANGWDNAAMFAYLSALPLQDVIYQVHCYAPSEFTHQGVDGRRTGFTYPDAARGWDKEFLREYLRPVREFQLRHGARIYVGEFSAVRWATGAEEYLRDCIALFEEYGWDWSYHAFREWEGWSVEHGEDPQDTRPASQDTARKRVLLEGFQHNQPDMHQ